MLFTRVLLGANNAANAAAAAAATARLTLFTRANCGLCDTAKLTVSKLRQRREFDYKEVDIMAPGNKEWKDVYEFDVPVLHVQSQSQMGRLSSSTSPQTQTQTQTETEIKSEPRKLFHRFTEQEVEKLVDEVELQ